MILILVLPILLVVIFTGVETWAWRVILLGAVAVCLVWSGLAGLILSVLIIIGVAFRNTLYGVTGSPM